MEEQAFENDFCIIKPCYRYEMCYAQVIIDGQRRALYILGQEHEALRAENGRLITDLKLTAERAGKLRAENERLKQVDADNDELRASTSGAYLQGLEQEIARLQVEAAAMRDAIRDAAIAVEELDYPTQDIFRAVGKLEKLAEQGTTGAAMLQRGRDSQASPGRER